MARAAIYEGDGTLLMTQWAIPNMSPAELQDYVAAGSDPNRATKPGAETGGFMRDCRTKGETALHRAAAFASEDTIQTLLDAGAIVDARDVNGDTPLGWASWYTRADTVLRKLCYGPFHVRDGRKSMEAYLRGEPRKS